MRQQQQMMRIVRGRGNMISGLRLCRRREKARSADDVRSPSVESQSSLAACSSPKRRDRGDVRAFYAYAYVVRLTWTERRQEEKLRSGLQECACSTMVLSLSRDSAHRCMTPPPHFPEDVGPVSLCRICARARRATSVVHSAALSDDATAFSLTAAATWSGAESLPARARIHPDGAGALSECGLFRWARRRDQQTSSANRVGSMQGSLYLAGRAAQTAFRRSAKQ